MMKVRIATHDLVFVIDDYYSLCGFDTLLFSSLLVGLMISVMGFAKLASNKKQKWWRFRERAKSKPVRHWKKMAPKWFSGSFFMLPLASLFFSAATHASFAFALHECLAYKIL